MKGDRDESPSALSRAAEDAQLAAVLEAYLCDLEAGHAPNAEQLIDTHPSIADRLRICLASLQAVEQVVAQVGTAVDALTAATTTAADRRFTTPVGERTCLTFRSSSKFRTALLLVLTGDPPPAPPAGLTEPPAGG